ncbi:MAG: hypothetical protein RLZZ84_2050 [Pseudomonadota bacterium]|jgi:DNA-binding CsgD family transcriptional regulator
MPLSKPDTPALPELTSKQHEVLALVADNRTSKEISTLLGISESAVNQRIESVRVRLGGMPRGELARLYRQFKASEDRRSPATDLNSHPWQKIHLPSHGDIYQDRCVEGIPPASPVWLAPNRNTGRDGSQLSAYDPGRDPAWLSRGGRSPASARVAFVVAALIVGLVIAAGVTLLVVPAFASS